MDSNNKSTKKLKRREFIKTTALSSGAITIGKIDSFGALEVRGNYPYKKPTVLPIGPSTHDTCDDCGICIEGCPVSAINPSNAAELDGLRCIDCFACIRNCPKQSKHMGVEIFNEHIDLLIEMCVTRKETEIFI